MTQTSTPPPCTTPPQDARVKKKASYLRTSICPTVGTTLCTTSWDQILSRDSSNYSSASTLYLSTTNASLVSFPWASISTTWGHTQGSAPSSVASVTWDSPKRVTWISIPRWYILELPNSCAPIVTNSSPKSSIFRCISGIFKKRPKVGPRNTQNKSTRHRLPTT